MSFMAFIIFFCYYNYILLKYANIYPAQTFRKIQLELPLMIWKEYWGENCLEKSD